MVQYDLLDQEAEAQALRQPGRKPGAVPWSVRDVFAIIALVAAADLVILGLFLRLLSPTSTEIIQDPLLSLAFLLLQWGVTLGAALGYLRLRRYSFRPATLGFRPTAPVMAALMVLAVLFLAYTGSAVYDQFITPQPQQALQEIQPGIYNLALALLQIVIIAPLAEETFFRGVIHQGLEQGLGFLPGAVLSASIFALAHFQLDIFVPIFLLGFGFAFLVHRTRSLWPSIGGHMLFNLVGVIATYTSLR